jgi:tetratricopeptide (TPR) repeat protein
MTRARRVIDEAIATSTQRGELLDRMQALTVKGDICAASAQNDEAAACFDEAIASARKQAARSMELRAAIRLAQLRQRQGNLAEARAVIESAYGWFTEGFDRPDLRDARAVMASLNTPSPLL